MPLMFLYKKYKYVNINFTKFMINLRISVVQDCLGISKYLDLFDLGIYYYLSILLYLICNRLGRATATKLWR